jgi:hypothetical protein
VAMLAIKGRARVGARAARSHYGTHAPGGFAISQKPSPPR